VAVDGLPLDTARSFSSAESGAGFSRLSGGNEIGARGAFGSPASGVAVASSAAGTGRGPSRLRR